MPGISATWHGAEHQPEHQRTPTGTVLRSAYYYPGDIGAATGFASFQDLVHQCSMETDKAIPGRFMPSVTTCIRIIGDVSTGPGVSLGAGLVSATSPPEMRRGVATSAPAQRVARKRTTHNPTPTIAGALGRVRLRNIERRNACSSPSSAIRSHRLSHRASVTPLLNERGQQFRAGAYPCVGLRT